MSERRGVIAREECITEVIWVKNFFFKGQKATFLLSQLLNVLCGWIFLMELCIKRCAGSVEVKVTALM